MKRLIHSLFYALGGIILLAVLLLVVGAWTFNRYGITYLSRYVETKTGFTLQVEKYNVHILAGSIQLKDVSIQNSNAFPPESSLSQFNEISVSFSPWSLLKETRMIYSLVVDVKDLSWIKNKEGKVNFFAFMEALKPPKETKEEELKLSSKEKKFLIKNLIVRLDTAHYADLSKTPPIEKQLHVHYACQFDNVSNVNQITEQMAQDLNSKGLVFVSQVFLESLTRFETYMDLGEQLIDKGEELLDSADNVKDTVKESVQNLFDHLKKE